jgi:hypothetical protein
MEGRMDFQIALVITMDNDNTYLLEHPSSKRNFNHVVSYVLSNRTWHFNFVDVISLNSM